MEEEYYIRCTTLDVDCTLESEVEKREAGVDTFGFEFFVPRSQANEMLFYSLMVLSNYRFVESGARLGKDVIIGESDVWTKEAIAQCINQNLSFLKEEKENKLLM